MMASGPRQRNQYRRRRSGETDYRRRLKLLKSGNSRAVVRISNTRVVCQVVSWKADGAIVVNSFEDAITKADEWIDLNMEINQNIIQKKIFLFGGAEIYKIGLEYCDNIEMTKVKFNLKTGTKFPKLNERDWEKTKLEHNLATIDIPEHSYWHYRRIV